MIETEIQKEESNIFFWKAISALKADGVDFLLGGAFATFEYTGVIRDTKDLDIFCQASDYQRVLKCLEAEGFRIELTDIRWLAKAFDGPYFIDIIFDSVNYLCSIDEDWFSNARDLDFLGIPVKMQPPEEIIWCKLYIQNRERFDGADINHIFLKMGRELDWERLYRRIGTHWHLLLAHILLFQFVYPSDYREIIPKWLFDDLLKKATAQYDLPSSVEKVCLGPLIDQTQYSIDIREWGYKVTTIKTV